MKKKKEKKVTETADDLKLNVIDNEAEETVEKELSPEEQIEALNMEIAEGKDNLLRLKADFQITECVQPKK